MVMSAIDELQEEGLKKGIEQGIEQGIEKGIEKGIEQGIEKGHEEVAAKLLLRGMKSDEIVELTRLNRKQVDSLRKRINGSSGQ